VIAEAIAAESPESKKEALNEQAENGVKILPLPEIN